MFYSKHKKIKKRKKEIKYIIELTHTMSAPNKQKLSLFGSLAQFTRPKSKQNWVVECMLKIIYVQAFIVLPYLSAKLGLIIYHVTIISYKI